MIYVSMYLSLNFSTFIGDQLYEKLARSICDSVVFFEAYRAITNSLARDRPDDLRRWLLEVETWEVDREKPCPYDALRKSESFWIYCAATHRCIEITLAEVKRAMAHRDNAVAQKEEVSRGKEETANSFIILGIELEAAQYILFL
jgi:hypothetical protein